MTCHCWRRYTNTSYEKVLVSTDTIGGVTHVVWDFHHIHFSCVASDPWAMATYKMKASKQRRPHNRRIQKKKKKNDILMIWQQKEFHRITYKPCTHLESPRIDQIQCNKMLFTLDIYSMVKCYMFSSYWWWWCALVFLDAINKSPAMNNSNPLFGCLRERKRQRYGVNNVIHIT